MSHHVPLFVQRLVPTAAAPVRGSAQAAGYDLSACLLDETGAPRADLGLGMDPVTHQFTLFPGERAAIPTGLAVTTPPSTYGRVGPRSGLAFKNGIDVMAGIVDRDYTGEMKVILINLGQKPFVISHGDRIAQLVLERIVQPDVEIVASLTNTDRGAGGFGSTGV